MPQPLTSAPDDVTYSPKIILKERPEHAARIGLIAAEWGALEQNLVNVFKFPNFIIPIPLFGGSIITAMRAIESLAGRLDIIEDLMRPLAAPELMQFWFNNLRPELRQRARERNRVIHGHWGVSARFPNDLILHDHEGKHLRYSFRDLEDIADRIITTSNKAVSFGTWLDDPTKAPFPVTPLPKRP
jgi:hypothetical protein